MANFIAFVLTATLLIAVTVMPSDAKQKKRVDVPQSGQGVMADTTGKGCGYRMVPGFAGGWIKVRNTNCQF